MTRSTLLTALSVSLLALGAAQAEEIHVFNWSDYIDEDLLAEFEQETGIKVVYDVFDSNEVLETKLLAGKSGYDVVVPTASFLERQIQAGVFQPLNKEMIPNLTHAWDVIADRVKASDPDNAYSVNYMWGTTGLGVNTAKVAEALGADAPVDSLSLVFDPANMEKLAACGVHFLDAPNEMIPAALAYLGEEPTSQDIDVIEKAEAVLAAVQPYIAKFHSSEYISALANGDICVAFGWSGDILQSRDRAAEAANGVEIVYNPPKEGALMWFDQFAVPADASNPEGAHKFINFMMEPKNAARNSNYIFYANGNKSSQEFIDPEVTGDPAIYPSAEALENTYVVNAYPQKAQRIMTRMWTKVKSGR